MIYYFNFGIPVPDKEGSWVDKPREYRFAYNYINKYTLSPSNKYIIWRDFTLL